ncbi:DUF3108 domain-containing protein [Methyloversatilis sp. XJ19-49]|uniref:DUF3108 domain-containing protein n=1 Tax=Methyloversatilis sp. XJ19-49 TaxID=2963429 RepID=UPI00211BDEBA|nr:DUF3108 domain-containing protein [Methyloversatilis sp. XJ19-49]MCQ9378395.1 DUF3108 domain-containing protein [Methyloversatilis sp. XJ19-49]
MSEPLNRSRLLFALAVSVLLHLLLAGGLRSFDHERLPDERRTIRAALLAPPDPPSPKTEPTPPPVAEATPVPVQTPKRPPRPRSPKPEPVALPEPEPELPPQPTPSDDPVTDDGESQDAIGDRELLDRAIAEGAVPDRDDTASLTPQRALVSEARLEFAVFRGELEIGETRYHWVHDGSDYEMDQITETTGLAGLLKPLRVEQRSTGEVTTDGLKPLRYVSRATQGRATEEEVVFDWDGNRVMLRAGTKQSEHPLSAGAQDMLSLWLEIIWRAQYGGDFDFTLATGKRYTPRWFVADPELGSLDTAIGRQLVKRLQARAQPGDNQIEVWLAPNLRWLPVLIRFTDRKGDVYDQRVRLIEYENLSLRAGTAAAGTTAPFGDPVDPPPRYEPAEEPANPYLR